MTVSLRKISSSSCTRLDLQPDKSNEANYIHQLYFRLPVIHSRPWAEILDTGLSMSV